MIGKRFGDLIVSTYHGKDRHYIHRWVCICKCGKKKIVSAGNLKNGSTKSCGCTRGSRIGKKLTRHGFSKSGRKRRSEYRIWSLIIQRCNNPNNPAYHNYGGKGITVCRRWLKFENFLADMGERPTKEHSIDRRDNNRGYTPKNCRWATRKQQARNSRTARLIRHNGETKTLSEWSELTGVPRQRITDRIDRLGWSVERALSQPVACRKGRS